MTPVKLTFLFALVKSVVISKYQILKKSMTYSVLQFYAYDVALVIKYFSDYQFLTTYVVGYSDLFNCEYIIITLQS